MPEYVTQKTNEAEERESEEMCTDLSVSSMENSTEYNYTPVNATFHDQVENLVNNTQKRQEIEADWLVGGSIAASIQTRRSKSSRGQQLRQIFPAASQDDLKTIAADETLVASMIDKADGLNCKRCFDYFYKYILNATLLEKMIELRFGVPIGKENVYWWWNRRKVSKLTRNQQEQSWTVNGLIHVYGVYLKLPPSDLELVKCLTTLDTNARHGVSGKTRSKDGVYYVNYRDDASKGAFDATNPINAMGKFSPDDTHTRTNLVSIDMTTAHEIGHIVDANAKGGRYSERFDSAGNAISGSFVEVSGWKRHDKRQGVANLYRVIKSYMDAPYRVSSGSPITRAEETAVDLAGEKILARRHYENNSDRSQMIMEAIIASGVHTISRYELSQKIAHSAVIEHLARANANDNTNAWQEELFPNLPNRQIHEDYLNKNYWYSYSNSARTGSKISTYQFRNPQEEFAETYASYHVANPKGSATPEGLKTWFESVGLDKSEELRNHDE